MPPIIKQIFNAFVLISFLIFMFILGANIWVISSTEGLILSKKDSTSLNRLVLVLGTSKRTSSGGNNRFFQERMNTAAMLYNEGRVKHLLVSGDNGTKFYNEPLDMLNALGRLNIPDTVVSLDYAGFRTLDSIVRAKEIFGQDSLTIVTQQFHCYRSLFIAKYFHIHAVAVAADEGEPIGHLLAAREMIARAIAVLELYILQRKPKFLGAEEELKIN